MCINYDVSLSVVKWIHLNWGDAGVRMLLLKVYNELTDKGIFILEIQPLSSYRKVKNLTERIKTNWETNQLKPQEIPLVAEQLGLKLIHTIQPPEKKGKRGTVGFVRPIHVFQKGPVPRVTGVAAAAVSSASALPAP